MEGFNSLVDNIEYSYAVSRTNRYGDNCINLDNNFPDMGIFSRAYKFYRFNVYNRDFDFRGATALNRWLKKAALRGAETYDGESESIFEAGEWDNLIILDACRHDLYEEVNGETQKRVTLGSHSREFIEETFSEGDFSDIVYITANYHFEQGIFEGLTGKKPKDMFHEVFHTFETDYSDKEGITMPEPMVRDAKTAKKLFPDKRLIVHFMQPHHPFVQTDWNNKFDDMPWNLAEKGILGKEEIWEAYRDNLEFVMPYAEDLAEELDGKTVVTSDHGNLAGEKGLYHHPYNCNTKGLREVPWDELS